jgi:hypothetical protein
LRQACREWISDGSKKSWLSAETQPRPADIDDSCEDAVRQLFYDLNDQYKLFRELGVALLTLRPYMPKKAYANLVDKISATVFGNSDMYFKYYVQAEDSIDDFPDMNSFVKWLSWVRKLGAVKI